MEDLRGVGAERPRDELSQCLQSPEEGGPRSANRVTRQRLGKIPTPNKCQGSEASGREGTESAMRRAVVGEAITSPRLAVVGCKLPGISSPAALKPQEVPDTKASRPGLLSHMKTCDLRLLFLNKNQ